MSCHGGVAGSGGSAATAAGCKISMLLNYDTIDACFITADWKITSSGMFAAMCLFAFLLATMIEMMGRLARDYDRRIAKKYVDRLAAAERRGGENATVTTAGAPAQILVEIPPFCPHIGQLAMRAILHATQFTVAYFVMLLAMYYNVYILVSIFLGVLLGSFAFQERLLEIA
ncbi:Copper Transporter integral membrane protein that functions in high affinity copper transport [Amphichorda felina]